MDQFGQRPITAGLCISLRLGGQLTYPVLIGFNRPIEYFQPLAKLRNAGFDRIVFVATSPAAVSACHRSIEAVRPEKGPSVEMMTWLDVG